MVGGKISGSAGSRGIIARWSAYSREPAQKGAQMFLWQPSRCFITWLTDQHDFTQSALLSAGRVTQMLTSLALKYNESLTPSC